MKVLIVEHTSESQAVLARRIESIGRVDKDVLDLSTGLSSPQNFVSKLSDTDVMVIGAELADRAPQLAFEAKQHNPALEILIFVPPLDYARGAFRSALSKGVRRVLPDNAPVLDIMQELLTIHEEFLASGKRRSGRVIAVVQPKGGLGATTACAALADACVTAGSRTLLWDLDIETRDLCRALVVEGGQASVVRSWIEDPGEISRDSLRKALMLVKPSFAVLPPPDQMGASSSFVGSIEFIDLVHSIVSLARATHDNVIVDTAGRMGPATATILRNADAVVVMVDDSILGISAAKFFLSTIRPLLHDLNSIYFLCSGISTPKAEIAKHFQTEAGCTENSWTLPPIPFDPAAARWAGTRSTLYSLGKHGTRAVFQKIAAELGMTATGNQLPPRRLLRDLLQKKESRSFTMEEKRRLSAGVFGFGRSRLGKPI